MRLAILALVMVLAGCEQPRPTPPARRDPRPTAAIVREASRAGEAANPGWRLLGQLSAHHMLVVEVEAGRVEDAKRIAIALCEPLKDRYAEMLVYVYRPGARKTLAARRVQWTLQQGYVETNFEESY
jgi:hypothetical protein